MIRIKVFILALMAGWVTGFIAQADNYYLKNVPDYKWHAGCFGTACGNLIGYWDRCGYPKMYEGPTNGGVAPLNSKDGPSQKNGGIISLWASEAGVDGRPMDQPGHMEDYYIKYENVGADPYLVEGRSEHTPDCIGDFIGLNQNKWRGMNGECDGNIDGYSFVFWEPEGKRRWNFVPQSADGDFIPDIPSGLRNWSRHRGYHADVFSQLSDFNPNIPLAEGFSFEDLKREIHAGCPVLIYMQDFDTYSRTVDGVSGINPDIHGMLAYGYFEGSNGQQRVRFRTSWADGDLKLAEWNAENWVFLPGSFPVRGFIGYHPRPEITDISRNGNAVTFSWIGPETRLIDAEINREIPLNYYVVEASNTLGIEGAFTAVTEPTTGHSATVESCCKDEIFYRLKLLSPEEASVYTGLN